MSENVESMLLADAAAVVDAVELDGVHFFRLAVELFEDLDDEAERRETLEPEYQLKIVCEETLGVRLAVSIDLGVGKVDVDAAIHYTLPPGSVVPPEVQLDFANRVGIMALLPFLRQAIADLTQRVFGEAVLMPVIRSGELAFSIDEREASSA